MLELVFASTTLAGAGLPPSVLDAQACPDDAAAYLAVEPPGAGPVSLVAALDVDRLSADAQVDALVAIERQIGWLQGRQQRVLAAIDARVQATAPPNRSGSANMAREEVGCALHLAGPTAAGRLAVAGILTGQLPATLQALQDGRITYWHARALAEAVAPMAEATAAQIEASVLPDAARQTVGEFRVAVGKAVLRADPASAEQRHQRALGDRCVRVRPVEDGMASLWALLPAEGAAALMATVDALASVTPADDPRTADHRRADALVDLGAAALHDPHLPKAQGLRPHIQVTVALSTLLGLDEHPAELGGYGAIHAELARRIAADPTATWRRLVTDPIGGALLDYGRRTYRPPADLARFVIARDRQCVFPHCHRPADRCDLDHRVRYSDGGETSAGNMVPICERHHYGKDEHGWQLRRDADGGYTWTSPTGHTYRNTPPPYPHPPPGQPPNDRPAAAGTPDDDPPPF